MKWSNQQIAELRRLCTEGKTNAEIAKALNVELKYVYSKRSQLGITIDKVKGMAAVPNKAFEDAVPSVNFKTPKGMCRSVKDAFEKLQTALILAMASNWTSVKDAQEYENLASAIIDLEEKHNKLIGTEA